MLVLVGNGGDRHGRACGDPHADRNDRSRANGSSIQLRGGRVGRGGCIIHRHRVSMHAMTVSGQPRHGRQHQRGKQQQSNGPSAMEDRSAF